MHWGHTLCDRMQRAGKGMQLLSTSLAIYRLIPWYTLCDRMNKYGSSMHLLSLFLAVYNIRIVSF